MNHIYGMSEQDIKNYFISIGEKPYRSTQIIEWLYRKDARSFAEMTNIKKTLQPVLAKDLLFDELELVVKQESKDGTIKFLFRLQDGNLIETVLMTHDYGYSVCVTTQVGCNMGCAFCASGLKKKKRNLETYELVLQVLMVQRLTGIKVSHIVVMGIGEPFDNYENVLKFLEILNNPFGLEIGQRHMTVSTCGIVPKIYEYSSFPLQVNLAISLHAPNDKIRNKLMPINKSYPLEVLIPALKDYISKTNRRVTIEYILIDGINDSVEAAHELSDLLRGMNAYINLIPYNEVLENPFKRSPKENRQKFYDTLKKRGMNVTLRKEQGSDIDAACGQLRSKQMIND